MKKRLLSLYGLVAVCLLLLTVRIIALNASDYSTASLDSHKKTIELASSRGKIYDRNMELLVDDSERMVAVFTPSVKAREILSRLKGEEFAEDIIESKQPYVAEVKEEFNDESIKTFHLPVRYGENSLACHLVGYVDAESEKGVTGVERGYDSFLSESGGKLSVSFSVDAAGGVLKGYSASVNDSGFSSKSGVVLTIDSDIQKIAEGALENSEIKSGCALVLHVDTAQVLALASVPKYDRNSLASELEKENSPLVNKALLSYSVGSVFKSVVAAYALECGVSEKTVFDCEGSFSLGDTVFTCYHSKSHGKQTMAKALQNSCNIYFIKLMEQLDVDSFLLFCRSLGLSRETEIAAGVVGQKGCLPSEESLKMPGERANFSFGQGKLLVTPLQMAGLYHALATGFYVEPNAVLGFANAEGLVKKKTQPQGKRVFSEKTVKTIGKMLSSVVEKGNGQAAKSGLVSLAGKTGTAQSGVYDGEREVCRTWFAGFFPSANPHYIVIVLNTDGEGGGVDCAPVFKEICENIVLNN